MTDLIDRKQLTETISEKLRVFQTDAQQADLLAECIENAPAVDAEMIVHAYWVPDPVYMGLGREILDGLGDDDNILSHYKCSVCGRRITHRKDKNLLAEYPYCHCGAKMIEVVTDA